LQPYVKLSAPELILSKATKQSVQILDLSNVDTSQYNHLYKLKHYFSASGLVGYPIQISDFDHDGLIDFAGAYKRIQDYQLADACIIELRTDSIFALRRVYEDSLTTALPVTDVNRDGLMELNFRRQKSFAQLRSTIQGSYPDSIEFSYLMWRGGGGEVSAETIADLDKDEYTDLLYVGDDYLEPSGRKKIFVAEYNEEIDNFEQKYRCYVDDWNTGGYSYGDFDDDGFSEFVTGSIHGHVYVFENSSDDSYSLIFDDTLSTSNAYLTVSTKGAAD